jgi:XTP/dITP diphosphohydrolase
MIRGMEILVASRNAHKLSEMRSLFPGRDLVSPEEAGIGAEAEEDGESFLDNALKKARALKAFYPGPVLADDSGLCVDALGGEPGIRSARYGSEGGAKLDSAARNGLLLSAMEGFGERSCRFVCSLVLLLSEHRFIAIEETMEGLLLREPRGRGGFGYDPVVFFPPLGKSVAELTEEEKNLHSHRGKAARRLMAAMDALGIDAFFL